MYIFFLSALVIFSSSSSTSSLDGGVKAPNFFFFRVKFGSLLNYIMNESIKSSEAAIHFFFFAQNSVLLISYMKSVSP